MISGVTHSVGMLADHTRTPGPAETTNTLAHVPLGLALAILRRLSRLPPRWFYRQRATDDKVHLRRDLRRDMRRDLLVTPRTPPRSVSLTDSVKML